MFALQRSAAQGGQVALPLSEGADEQALLRAALADRPRRPRDDKPGERGRRVCLRRLRLALRLRPWRTLRFAL